MNYPRPLPDSKVIREAAESFGVPLVDQESFFTRLQQEGTDRDLFAADGHLNAKGYRLMAENAAEVLSHLDLCQGQERDLRMP